MIFHNSRALVLTGALAYPVAVAAHMLVHAIGAGASFVFATPSHGVMLVTAALALSLAAYVCGAGRSGAEIRRRSALIGAGARADGGLGRAVALQALLITALLALPLGLLVAWAGGAWATFRGSGPVFFDAIAMLVFFVLLARAFETRARLSAAAIFDRFAVVQPGAARRIGPNGLESEVAALDLRPGDVIRARPDETVPADGILLEGSSSFDEAVLTGEPWPRPREAGEDVVAGSRNCGPAVPGCTQGFA